MTVGMLGGRVAIVTGAGRGLGEGIAHHIAAEGAKLALVARTAAALQDVAKDIEKQGAVVSIHPGDISAEADVERVIREVMKTHGRIDVIVNNAGIVDEAKFLDIDLNRWNSVIATNLTGTFLMTQRGARRMKDHGGGAIVNISSIDANGYDGPQASYVAAKAGIVGLTKDAATELAEFGIRVNSVSPGWTRTKMIEEFVAPDALNYMLTNFERVPMRRMVEIKEVAEAVAFLASSRASGITGIDVPVDCGTLSTLYLYETLPQ
jgi:NAD(P)-dependent dehydrogenase (short-subunit alcohol dehydrogenase family)